MYVAGQYAAAAEATVSATDAGLLLGAGLFETVRVYAGAEGDAAETDSGSLQPGRPLRLAAHLARMRASGQVLRIFVGETDDEVAAIIRRLLEANRLTQARVRLTATRGPLEQGLEDDVKPRATLLVAAGPMTHYPPDFYSQGVTVVVSDIRANETDPTTFHKTIAYMRNLLALRDAHRARAAEVLFFNTRKRLAGGALSNVFLVKGSRLLTPPVEDGLVPGITRATVLELAAEVGVPAEQTSLIISDLLEADEVFLTNSVMEVLPVVKVEGHEVGPKEKPDLLGRPGPITQRLAEAYRALAAKETA
jgi:branched-chain amino acid aminotransferase